MGILDSNFRKVESIKKKSTLAYNLDITKDFTIPVQYDRDLYVEITVTKTTGDAKIAFSATTDIGVSSHWLQNLVKYTNLAEPVSNQFTLIDGKNTFSLDAYNMSNYKSIEIVATLTGDAKVTINYYYKDSKERRLIKLAGLGDAIHLLPEKIYKLSTFSTIKTTGVYSTINLIDRQSNWFQSRIKTNSVVTKKGGLTVLNTDAEYFIDTRNAGNIPYFSLIFSVVGGATANMFLEEVSEMPIITSNRIFETTTSIGYAYYYARKESDKTIKVTARVTNIQAGFNTITFKPVNIGGETIPVKFHLWGDDTPRFNSYTFIDDGTYEFYFDVPNNLYRLRIAASLVTNTELFVEAEGLNYNVNLESTIFENETFIVEKYKEAEMFTRFENWEASVKDNLITINNGVVQATAAVTDLPFWKSGDSISVIGFIPYKQGVLTTNAYSRETSTRLCLVTRLGNIYHNFPASASDDSTTAPLGMYSFDLSAIYQTTFGTESLSSERIPSKNVGLTLEEQKTHRYEPGLPAWNYTQHTDNIGGFKDTAKTIPYGNGGHPPVIDKGGYKHIRLVDPFPYGTNPQNPSYPHQLGGYLGEPFVVKPKMTLFVPYVGINFKRNMVLGTTDGGRTWYVLHELGIGDFMAKWGNSLDYSAIGAYNTNELSVVEREYIYPTDSVKEPINAFKYKAPITVSSISTSGGKTTVTTSTAHGITDGKYIVFKKNVSGNYDFLENTITSGQTTTFDSNSVGNGRFYTAKVTGANTFELLQNLGGADEKIKTHHIHGGSTAKDGAVISCGERYPNGWICYVRIPQIDDFENVQITSYKANNPYIIRINSSEKAVQRSVGFILNDDMNQTFLFGSDEAHIDRGFVAIEGRTTTFKRNSAGIFKGELRYIDDLTKAECVLEMEEASLGIINKQNMYVVIGMSRNTYFSKDAKEWFNVPFVSQYVGGYNNNSFFKASNIIYKITRK